jgi:MFS family permease
VSDTTQPGEEHLGADQPEQPAHETVSVRRAPKIPAFLVVGGLLGFIATLIITGLFPSDPSVGFTTLAAYFSLYGITIGVLVGAIVGIVLDRRSRRRARVVQADRESGEPSA